MRRARSWLGLLLLVAIPAVDAGSETNPELADAVGDTPGPNDATTFGDIHAAWVDAETDDVFTVMLKVGRVASEPTPATYQVVWFVTREGASPRQVGVRADLGPAGTSAWWVMQRDGDGGWMDTPTGGAVRTGTPAYLVWTVPRQAIAVRAGDLFWDFKANTHAATDDASALPALDEAEGTGAYRLGGVADFLLEPFEVPTRGADLNDARDVALAGPIDLLGLWIDFDEAALNLTFQVRSFRLSDWKDCESPHAGVWASQVSLAWLGPGLENRITLQAQVSKDHGLLGVRLGRDGRSEALNGTLYAAEGEPGNLRLSYERTLWQTETDFELLDVFAALTSYCDGFDEASDYVTHHPRGVPLPVWLALAGLAAAALIRGRRRRNL